MIDSINFFSSSNAEVDKLYVLGGMEELGENERVLHYKVGRGLRLQRLGDFDSEKAGWMAEGILESRAREEQIIILPDRESAASIIEDFQGAVFFKEAARLN